MKILLVQTSFLGDVILSTPVISAIKQKHPEAKISVLCTPLAVGLLKLDPLLDEVIPFDKHNADAGPRGLMKMALRLRNCRFDLVYALQRSFRTAFLLWLARIPRRVGFEESAGAFLYSSRVTRPKAVHDVLRNLSIIDRSESSEIPQLRLIAPNSIKLPAFSVEKLTKGSYVCLAPGSAWETKRWHSSGYRRIAEELLDDGRQVVLLGSEDEREVCAATGCGLDVVDLSGKTAVADLLYLIKNAAVLLCNDSAVLHIASAFKVPTVAVFCATSPVFGFGPWQNPNALVVEKEGLACKPCRRHGSRKCPNGTEACMRELPAEIVMQSVRKLLNSPAVKARQL